MTEKSARRLTLFICTGRQEYPHNVQNWLLGERLAKAGHDVTLFIDKSTLWDKLPTEWKGCRVCEWPSKRLYSLANLVLFWR